MRHNLSRAAEICFAPKRLVPFLVSAVSLAVIGNAITQMWLKGFGEGWPSLVILFSAAVFVIGLTLGMLIRTLKESQPGSGIGLPIRPAPRRGLILLISINPTTMKTYRRAIGYHGSALERCWLICSKDSLRIANELREEYPKVTKSDPIVINNINDPLEFCQRVNEIYAQLPEGWYENDIISDYTGMTAHGSVGMALACLSAQRPLEYVPPRTIDPEGRGTEPDDPIEITLNERHLGLSRAFTELPSAGQPVPRAVSPG